MTRSLLHAVGAAAVAASLAAPGCSSPTETQRLLIELEAAEAHWHHVRPSEYEAVQGRLCECTPAMAGPVRLRIALQQESATSGEIESIIEATYTAGGEHVPTEFLSSFLTVQRLFDLIREAVEEGAHSVEATFDEELGYPRNVSVDWNEQIADEESIYQMELVEP